MYSTTPFPMHKTRVPGFARICRTTTGKLWGGKRLAFVVVRTEINPSSDLKFNLAAVSIPVSKVLLPGFTNSLPNPAANRDKQQAKKHRNKTTRDGIEKHGDPRQRFDGDALKVTTGLYVISMPAAAFVGRA